MGRHRASKPKVMTHFALQVAPQAYRGMAGVQRVMGYVIDDFRKTTRSLADLHSWRLDGFTVATSIQGKGACCGSKDLSAVPKNSGSRCSSRNNWQCRFMAFIAILERLICVQCPMTDYVLAAQETSVPKSLRTPSSKAKGGLGTLECKNSPRAK